MKRPGYLAATRKAMILLALVFLLLTVLPLRMMVMNCITALTQMTRRSQGFAIVIKVIILA
jgi:hypothetical protein